MQIYFKIIHFQMISCNKRMVYVLNKPFAFIYKALTVSMSCGCFQLFHYMMRKHLGMRADICLGGAWIHVGSIPFIFFFGHDLHLIVVMLRFHQILCVISAAAAGDRLACRPHKRLHDGVWFVSWNRMVTLFGSILYRTSRI